MSNIIKFPNSASKLAAVPPAVALDGPVKVSNSKGKAVLAGWTFLLHFAVLTALTYFVSIYKPKGI